MKYEIDNRSLRRHLELNKLDLNRDMNKFANMN